MTRRGEVVVVDFPFSDGSGSKVRPSLVVQNDIDNGRQFNTVVAMITGNTRYSGKATQWLIDPASPDGKTTGLHGISVVKCNVLFTVDQRTILRTIGHLSASAMQNIDNCLKSALQLP